MASISSPHRSETAAIWWRGAAIWAAVEVVSGRLSAEVVSDSAAREVVLVCGEGVGAIAVHRRRLRPLRRILHGDASSTAQHRRRRSIDDGIIHGAVSMTASSTAQHPAWREICTSVSPVSFPSARDLHGEGVSSYHRSTFVVAHGVDRIGRRYLRGFVVCFDLDASGGEMILGGGGRGVELIILVEVVSEHVAFYIK
jgi:hypothetical protein